MTKTVRPAQQDIPGMTITLEGMGVQVSKLQGVREYQEDEVMLASNVPVAKGHELAFVEKSIRDAVEHTNKTAHGGSTLVAALVTEDRMLHAGGLGDSEINIYVRDKETGDITAMRVTRVHTLDDKDERARIMGNADPNPHMQQDGVTVYKGENGWIHKDAYDTRLIDPRTGWSTLATRGCGDTDIPGMSGALDPGKDIKSVDLKQWPAGKFDVYVELCTDGLSGITDPADPYGEKAIPLTLTDRVNNLQRVLKDDPKANIADALTNFAMAKGSYDNCTSVVFDANQPVKGNAFLVVADGHTVKQKGKPPQKNPALDVMTSMERSAHMGLQPAGPSKTVIMEKPAPRRPQPSSPSL